MLCSTFLLLALQGAADRDASVALPAYQPVSWAEFCRDHFDPDWALPLPTEKEAGKLPVDLVAWFQEFATRDFNLAPGTEAGPEHRPILLGDLIAELAPYREDTKRLLEELDRREQELPGLSKSERRNLGELLCDGGLFHKKWTPADNRRDDGILHLPSWEMKDKTGRSTLWTERSGDDTVLRAATLVFADLESWFAAENDCPSYFDQPDNRFEKVEIPAQSRVFAKSPEGDEYRAQIFRVVSDLPFPFGTYGGDNRVRLSLRPDGLVMNEVYMAKNKDFHWLAGRDVFLPIRTQDGRFVCLLVIQEFGFDLDGVPESDGNRKEAVRAALGNKKRGAEMRFRPQAELAPQRGRLPRRAVEAESSAAAPASSRDR